MLAKNKNNKNKGQVLVLVALSLVVFIGFAALAIDVAYFYHTRHQLQGAADAAALAGAAKLNSNDTTSTTQTSARAEAESFAAKNTAAGSPADISNDGTNILTPTNDITVGFWNFTSYAPGNTPVNAVQARTRRTGESSPLGLSPRGPVNTFFGRIFNVNTVNIKAEAIATRPARANAPIAICTRTCTDASVSPTNPLTLYWAPYPSEVNPGYQGIAWTVFSETSQATPTQQLIRYFCGDVFNACNLTVYSSNGNNNAAARQFRCAFKNPRYDSANKTCGDGNCDSITDNVTSWSVIVPVFDEATGGCPPGDQPGPQTIVKYAKVRIIEVYASGSGGTSRCACEAYNADRTYGPTDNAIKIDDVRCVDCPATEFLGTKAVLVR